MKTMTDKKKTASAGKLPSWLYAIWGMAALGILSGIMTAFERTFFSPTAQFVICCALSYSALFVCFLCLEEGKRTRAALFACIPLLTECLNGAQGILSALDAAPSTMPTGAVINALCYIALPLLLLLFILLRKPGHSGNGLPMTGVVTAAFLLFINLTGYLNVLAGVWRVYGMGYILIVAAVFILARLAYYCIFMTGLWKCAGLSFVKKAPWEK